MIGPTPESYENDPFLHSMKRRSSNVKNYMVNCSGGHQIGERIVGYILIIPHECCFTSYIDNILIRFMNIFINISIKNVNITF